MIRTNTHHRRRRGVAMLLVLGVIAMATVLGYAMLATGSLQKQVSSNGAATAGAQGMAESGVNLAMYYLQHPDKRNDYPATYPETENYDRAGTYWRGTGGQFVNVGSPVAGSIKVTVNRSNPAIRWQYDIQAVGRAAGSAVERKVEATVWVNSEYKIRHAAMFSNDVTFTAGSRVGQNGQGNGDVYSNGAVIIRSTANVWGTGLRRKSLSTPVRPFLNWVTPVPLVPQVVPRNGTEVRDYRTYEMPAGTPRVASTLTIAAIGDGTGTMRLQASTANPAGIFYAPGNFTLTRNAEVRGTLIVAGNLLVDGGEITCRANDGFPALLVNGDIRFTNGLGTSNLTVEGVTWVGGKIDATLAQYPALTSTGALLVNGASPIFALTSGGKVFLNFDSNRTALPDLSDVGRTPQNVKVISWRGQ